VAVEHGGVRFRRGPVGGVPPLLDDFARCFAAVSPERAEVLAGSFAFDQCARREELAAILREHLSVTAAGPAGT